ncbi:MAG: undecaprenyl-phosphate glucose phosphotransferase [Acetobacteraceae bacterium]|nr:undecaprenyl-phosphate glucose phosphotransferase [Acetobacteraceae bacterium]
MNRVAPSVAAEAGSTSIGRMARVEALRARPAVPLAHAVLVLCVGMIDATVLGLTALIAARLAGTVMPGIELRAALFGIPLTIALASFGGVYGKGAFHNPLRQTQPLLAAGAAAGFAASIAALLFSPEPPNTGWLVLWACLALPAVPLARAGIAHLLLSNPGRFAERTVVIGGGTNGARLVQFLRRRDDRSIRVLGFVDDRYTRLGTEMDSLPFLGPIDEVFSLIRRGAVDQVILAMPWSAEERTLNLLHLLSEYPVHVRLAPDLISYHFPGRSVTDVGGVSLMHLMDRPISGWSSMLKTVEDKLLAGLMLAVAAVPMLLIAAAIKLDSPGPVFFRQRRVGFNNREFWMLKFRSMRHDPREQLQIRHQARRDDPRVTRVGRILRRTSLDELPQIINVLLGDMSIVGPRPHASGTRAGGRPFEDVVARYAARHRVKPGLTGLAQVRGLRGETDTEEKLIRRVDADLEYIETWSVWLDIAILMRTALVVLRMQNAH